MARITLIVAGIILLAGDPALARPPHKRAVAEHLGKFLPKKLNDCILCHVPEKPGTTPVDEEERAHNVFGARLAAVRKELQKAGKKTDIVSRLEAIADEDSDGDGLTNLLEMLAGHNPGDKADAATPAEGQLAKKTLVVLREKLKEYKWRPFEIVQRPAVPTNIKNKEWSHHPIDAFLAAEHEKHGLTPRPEAPRRVLARRLYLDLIGLPPTPEEVQAFVADTSPQAYEKLVDKLLASPHYGERWGRHWMDVWRYSDWYGYGAEVRNSQPHIWRWRDWIIESVNEDKPYERMIVEMLAGDEVAPTDQKTLRATGFLVRNWFKFNRDVWLDNTIEHTAKAFLGVTLNCARCHDHFFDAISQKEYYQFRALFEPYDVRTDKVPGKLDTKIDGLARVFDSKLTQPTFLFIRGEDKLPDKKNPLTPAFLSLLGGADAKFEPIKLPPEAVAPEKQPWIIEQMLKDADAAVAKSAAALDKAADKAFAQLEHELAKAKQAATLALLAAEKAEDQKDAAYQTVAKAALKAQREAALLEAKRNLVQAQKGTKDAKADKKLADAQAALTKAEDALKQPLTAAYQKRAMTSYPAISTGRRLALAKWIADKQNPLTARVAVNHIWLRHFGKPLVPSTFDFGGNGQPPTHPALMDWLAAEFMDGGWSMKKMHRLMVTSAAYRMSSASDPANFARDEDNRWLWRMNTRRMESEIVRDSVLAVAGQLDRTLGGPELDANLGLTTKRRSIYYRHAPEKMMEFLDLFDAANVTECYQRTESVVPQQALALANSTLVLSQARLLARSISEKLGKDAAAPKFIQAGFERVLCRPPTADEVQLCEEFLQEQAKTLANAKSLSTFPGGQAAVAASSDPVLRARENLVHVLLNHNEFVTIR